MFIEKPASKKSLSFRKSIYGSGINDAWYMIEYKDRTGKRTMCPYYRVWTNMIERCYSKKLHKINPTYSGCTVSKEWLIFSTFKEWMTSQDWQVKELDKDIITPGNKQYAPVFCLFVDQKINKLLISCNSSRGYFPRGVTFHKPNNKFQARCRAYGGSKNLGSFNSSEEASLAYKKFKSKHILEVAEEYKNEPRLYEALKNHARLMLL